MNDERGAPTTGEPVRFLLPEPPSLNEIVELAKKGRRGMVYWSRQQAYQNRAKIMMRNQHPRPDVPWPKWVIVRQHYRLWNERDLPELSVGLKWAVDALHQAGYVEDDSPRHLVDVAKPTQEIDRMIDREEEGFILEIAELLSYE